VLAPVPVPAAFGYTTALRASMFAICRGSSRQLCRHEISSYLLEELSRVVERLNEIIGD
jgi:hypothetical protein